MSKENKQEWLLVKFSDNWADEMDLEGFEVVTRKQYDDFVAEKLKSPSEDDDDYEGGSFCRCFGTNEENEYDSFQAYLDETVKIVEITESEAAVLTKFFPNGSGFTPFY